MGPVLLMVAGGVVGALTTGWMLDGRGGEGERSADVETNSRTGGIDAPNAGFDEAEDLVIHSDGDWHDHARLARLLGKMGADQFPALVKAAMDSRGPRGGNPFFRGIVAAWARCDGEAARHFVERLPEQSPVKLAAHLGLLEGWLQRDAEAALRRMADLKDVPFRRALGVTLYNESLPQAPELALRIANSFDRGGMGVRGAIEAWAEKDAEGVTAWGLAQPSGARRQLLTVDLVAALARKSPERAAGLLTQVESPQHREIAVARLVLGWAAEDPNAALAWASA